MVLDPGLVVGVDVRADEPRLALAHVRVGLLQADAPVPKGLHFAPRQHEARLEALEEVVVVPCLAVLGNRLFICHCSIVGRCHVADLPPFRP